MIIISGGQTGVDRAALDFALSHEIPCGGYCPEGRIAEDGRIPDRYPLRETKTVEYAERTEKNVLAGDGTLILYSGSMAGGTQFTYLCVRSAGKPLFTCDLEQPIPVRRFQSWIRKNQIRTLNIAGPRESQQPGIYSRVIDILAKLFADV
ncbi:MAG: molybdenum cofactor carrier [Bacteroidetes bacterium]|nr:MAG: molybdenum cofactor carrier [Bacteroidota bacterium]